jgi:hypothetical protein
MDMVSSISSSSERRGSQVGGYEAGIGGLITSAGAILVLYILLVIVTRGFI